MRNTKKIIIALYRGKANLNFDVSFIQFRSLFEKLQAKYFFYDFRKSSKNVKNEGIKFN